MAEVSANIWSEIILRSFSWEQELREGFIMFEYLDYVMGQLYVPFINKLHIL